MTTAVPIGVLEIIRAVRENELQNDPALINYHVKSDPSCIPCIFDLALECARAGRLPEAILIFKDLRHHAADDVRIPYNLGLLKTMIGDDVAALYFYKIALTIDPNNIDTLVNIGSIKIQQSHYLEALKFLDKALSLKRDLPEAWSNKGIALNNLCMFEDSIRAYEEAIFYAPNFPSAWSNRAIPFIRNGNLPEALSTCDKALSLKPDYAEAYSNKAVTLNELKRYEEALFHYDKALSLKPDYAEAYSNKAVTLSELGLYVDAVSHLDRALSIAPNFPEAWLNKGVALKELNQYEEALFHYDKALSLKPDYAEAWSNKASVLGELGRYGEALGDYRKALDLKPRLDWVYGDFLHLKMKTCSWVNFHEDMRVVSDGVMDGEKIIQPFSLLALVDDPLLHQKSAEIYIEDKCPINPSLGPIEQYQKRAKIRIGYFSADFKNHPVSILTAQLFELHDRNQFEIFAFSFGPDDQSQMRKRLVRAFDHFIEVGNRSDRDIAEMSRNLGIDIAVDLKGYTKDARTGIFALRAAPIQINYLGYPGTLGANYFEYLIADRTVIPAESQKYYTEKIVYLPQSFMPSDSLRELPRKNILRQQFQLPENSFVFCCFNNDYKYNKSVLGGWKRILSNIDDSILWISENNKFARKNLEVEFKKFQIDPCRIVFSPRIDSMADHLARHRLADLFLDTYPYNAHTTASDALWTGLPVITLQGKSFASRVAASLLNAINLPELIATTQTEYEDLAINLANNPEKLGAIKRRLDVNRMTAPLFNTPLFTKNIESAYTEIMMRYWGGLKPDHIYL